MITTLLITTGCVALIMVPVDFIIAIYKNDIMFLVYAMAFLVMGLLAFCAVMPPSPLS